MPRTLNINYASLNDPAGAVWCGPNLDMSLKCDRVLVFWTGFKSTVHCFFNSPVFLLADAVKVQKSNHHPWDQSSNYCHSPHASYSKTWSSPSHPHSQQDLCRCKLSHVTALLLLLLARLFNRSLFSSAQEFNQFPWRLHRCWWGLFFT